MTRELLPNRREGETFKLSVNGIRYFATVNHYPDGRVAEIFFHAGKVGSAADTVARDLGIVVSLALQHGCPLETIHGACLLNYEKDGHDGLLGNLLDQICGPRQST